MATINTRTIGSGGTYADINTWRIAVLAIHTDFVSADVIEKGEVVSNLSTSSEQNISGATTDSTRYWHLTGNITNVVMKAGNLRKLDFNAQRVSGISNSDSYTEISWLEVTNWQAESGIHASQIANVHHCIAHETASSGTTYWDTPVGIEISKFGTELSCNNNLVYNISNKHTASSSENYQGYGMDMYNNINCYNNTVFNCSTLCIRDSYSGIKLFNNIAMLDTSWTYYSNAGGTAGCFEGLSTSGGYNMDSDGTLPGGFNNQLSKTIGNQFIDYTTDDFNLKSGADALSNGLVDANTPTQDFEGHSRAAIGQPCDIGADELPIGGPLVGRTPISSLVGGKLTG